MITASLKACLASIKPATSEKLMFPFFKTVSSIAIRRLEKDKLYHENSLKLFLINNGSRLLHIRAGSLELMLSSARTLDPIRLTALTNTAITRQL